MNHLLFLEMASGLGAAFNFTPLHLNSYEESTEMTQLANEPATTYAKERIRDIRKLGRV